MRKLLFILLLVTGCDTVADSPADKAPKFDLAITFGSFNGKGILTVHRYSCPDAKGSMIYTNCAALRAEWEPQKVEVRPHSLCKPPCE